MPPDLPAPPEPPEPPGAPQPPDPPEPREDDRIVLADPRAIRALAHPARLAIIEALLPGEELTATECAGLTGLSPSATSYHLKALQKWGIVEAGAPRADGRDRPWRAAGRSIEVNSEAPAGTVAEVAAIGTFLDRNRAIITAFLEQQDREPPEWRDAVHLSNGDYWLTAAEVAAASRAIQRVLEPYGKRRRDARPAGSRRVRVSRLIVPRAEPGEHEPADPEPRAPEPRAPEPGDHGPGDHEPGTGGRAAPARRSPPLAGRGDAGQPALRPGEPGEPAGAGVGAAAQRPGTGAALMDDGAAGAARLHHVDAAVGRTAVAAGADRGPHAGAHGEREQHPGHDREHPLLPRGQRFPAPVGVAALHAGQA